MNFCSFAHDRAATTQAAGVCHCGSVSLRQQREFLPGTHFMVMFDVPKSGVHGDPYLTDLQQLAGNSCGTLHQAATAGGDISSN